MWEVPCLDFTVTFTWKERPVKTLRVTVTALDMMAIVLGLLAIKAVLP